MAKASSAAAKQTTLPESVVEAPKLAAWEFASDTWKRDEQQIFERRAADGWDLVCVTESANHERRYYFKRPKQ